MDPFVVHYENPSTKETGTNHWDTPQQARENAADLRMLGFTVRITNANGQPIDETTMKPKVP